MNAGLGLQSPRNFILVLMNGPLEVWYGNLVSALWQERAVPKTKRRYKLIPYVCGTSQPTLSRIFLKIAHTVILLARLWFQVYYGHILDKVLRKYF